MGSGGQANALTNNPESKDTSETGKSLLDRIDRIFQDSKF